MNKVILMGRLTRDPELKQTNSGVSLCNFTLAVDRSYKDRDGNKQTDFINCIAWRKTAEFTSKYFQKGDRMAVIGSWENRSWEDNEGNKKYVSECIVDEAHFADNKSSQNKTNDGNERGDAYSEEDDLPI